MPHLDDFDAVSLSALMSSRLCHDLVNPIGALASGLEVLADPAMDAAMKEAALDLIKSSAEKSVALLKFARLAYGASGGLGAELPFEEARHVLEGYLRWTKASLDWRIAPVHAPKDEVRAVLVLAAAAADCVPRGGGVFVEGGQGGYEIRATSQRVIVQDDMRRAIAGDASDLKPKFTPHYLAALAARRTGGGVIVAQDDEGLKLTVRFAAREAAPTLLTAS